MEHVCIDSKTTMRFHAIVTVVHLVVNFRPNLPYCETYELLKKKERRGMHSNKSVERPPFSVKWRLICKNNFIMTPQMLKF